MTEAPSPTAPALEPGAVLYTRDTEDRGVLARFASTLRERGWKVGGIVQETLRNGDGIKVGMDLVEVDCERRIPLARPTPGQIADGTCALDTAALAESTEAIRRAVAEDMDLIVIEKFGDRERHHEGLADEILMAMAEGIPTLIAVPALALEDWNQFSGGLGVLLPSEMAALWRWWGPHRLYTDLVLDVPEAPVGRVATGARMVMVEGPSGCGVAPLPENAPPPPCPKNPTLRGLAEMLHSWDKSEAALGLAAVNAHYNRRGLASKEEGVSPLATGFDGPLVVVGHLPRLAERLGARHLVGRRVSPDAFPPTALRWLLPGKEGVVIAASALADKTLPSILESCRLADTALVGAATPLTPRLHAYGLNRLAGLVITDADDALRAVEDGAGAKDLEAFGRPVTLEG